MKFIDMMISELSNYLAPANKLRRLIEKGEIIKLTKGLYETNQNISGYLVANAIYGPSYLSFDYALAYLYEILLIQEGDYYYSIASAEKALCDKLYTLNSVHSKKELIHLLFEDLRIDQDEFLK